MKSPIAFLAGGLALASLSPAVVWRNDVSAAQIATFGQDARFGGVGFVEEGGGFGTGTFIGYGNGSGWVLTANHVLGNGQAGTFRIPNVGSWGLSQTYRLPGTDVSIARLTGFNLNVFTPVLAMTAVAAGTPFVSAGYGGSRPESGDTYTFDNTRRGFQSVTTGIFNSTSSPTSTFPGPYVTDRFDAPGSANVQPLEGFGAPGDSGSMVLTADGIVGVLSYGDYEKYGGINYYSQVTPALSTAIYARTGINPVPEPATLAALGLGALAMLRRRRSRA